MMEGCRGSVGGCPAAQVEVCRWEMVGGCSVGSEEGETWSG